MLAQVSKTKLHFASLIFALALFIPGLATNGQETADSKASSNLKQWISQLADPSPAIRKAAEARILELGETALPAVKAGMRTGGLEIHNRCKILLEKIESARREELSEIFLNAADDDKRLEAYRAWPKFSQFVESKNVLSRKLFLKMCNQLPTLFEAHDFKSEQTAPAFKQAARMVLVPETHHGATPDVLAIAYLFLAEQARLSSKSEKPLFDDVEVLEAVNFISNADYARRIRESDFRELVNRSVANWIAQNDGRKIPANAKVKLIYETGNERLIDGMVHNYQSLQLREKLEFIDIIYRASIGKNCAEIGRCEAWLQKPLQDETSLPKHGFENDQLKKLKSA